jgi:hypothetical protein
MIFRVNFGFHGNSFGAPAPVFKVAVGTDLGRSITQQDPQNKPNPVPAAIFPVGTREDLPAVTMEPICNGQEPIGQIS